MSPRDDLASAFALLTRLPMPAHRPTGAGAAWAWPLVGVALGLAASLVAAGALSLGLSAALAAVVVIGVEAMLTGALHEDGLADSADGLWGGRDKTARLAIMKDSRIGTYGTLALVLAMLARWAALVAILQDGRLAAIVAAAALSRAVMAGVQWALPNARGSGLSETVGRPEREIAGAACGLAAALALVLAGWAGLSMILAATAAGLAVVLIARAKLGGQTGDILGFSQQLSLVAALSVA